MGKRKGQSEISETLISCRGKKGGEECNETVSREEKGGFFACYLLTSLSPRHKGHSYIGFTVNPRRRIRQHNGEIGSGAWRTKSKRPWEMVLCIYGFPTQCSALQFEWAWQHPTESLAVRNAAATFKSLSGLANKIKLAYTMLNLPSWQSLHLTVNFFSTKYTKHSAGCPSLPEHMRVQFGSMDELPCYTSIDDNIHENEGHLDDDDDGDEICDKTCSAYVYVNEELTDITVDSDRDCWMSNEEDNFMRKSGDLLSSTEDHRPVEDRDMYPSTEESGVELDQSTSKEMLPSVRAANNDQPPINSAIALGEIAVIDLLTPSPGYRISSSRKKRNLSYVCPEIIDLTKSPIFV
ncbi:Structure-specific endonuclease [Actinidia chinensis var. chinensis]|uniref:Structure-specific endonuclease subunit SLX1 homolog n=1 Tax=Actinidia chinensis var. chinensis TaxID=1590841 RepID=A0A2R6P6F7_ACTCC|nr:Structure-specific endonuclease [Actinidia chinensis var. chinensis]